MQVQRRARRSGSRAHAHHRPASWRPLRTSPRRFLAHIGAGASGPLALLIVVLAMAGQGQWNKIPDELFVSCRSPPYRLELLAHFRFCFATKVAYVLIRPCRRVALVAWRGPT